MWSPLSDFLGLFWQKEFVTSHFSLGFWMCLLVTSLYSCPAIKVCFCVRQLFKLWGQGWGDVHLSENNNIKLQALFLPKWGSRMVSKFAWIFSSSFYMVRTGYYTQQYHSVQGCELALCPIRATEQVPETAWLICFGIQNRQVCVLYIPVKWGHWFASTDRKSHELCFLFKFYCKHDCWISDSASQVVCKNP